MLPLTALSALTADPDTLGIGALVAAILVIEMRLLRRELKIAIAAIMERSRIRDARRRRRESLQPQNTRRTPSQPMAAVPEPWEDSDTTDLHELMELERQHERARRNTDRQRRHGERPPRPGTHHDREE
jgi:hypothetical protein